ncbi:ferredoxin reductase-like C-terminal NADP-linked domain-containing protein [Sistotremastrum niveocremeum HHB9708]|uniref:NADH-cytochrome b5 reductase n=2 Tax=Sistotremastraceae TaxID=3402574 RepID=A0A164UDK3_9AGAM|nr:ferredoxin reductase-like C-terminal NADP-linked domain-containing protein [Sistotremastrum niveocremeum HHB9708]KZT42560.1 ferredoxin reductase-like protein [Sistotremastrum suecicum HHB10207 ss-3]
MDAIKTSIAQILATPTGFLTVAVTLFCTVGYVILKFGMPARRPVLDPHQFKEFTLAEKIPISPNTALYRFSLERESDVLGLPIGQHVSVGAEIDGKEIVRSYTPTSSDDDMGYFDLVVKSYEKGNISRYLGLIKVGQKVRVKGPKGQFQYSKHLTKSIGMIAGGTGITPMLQIIRQALKDPYDFTKLSLIYANVNEEDILLKFELDELVDANREQFKVYYVLNNPPANWKGGAGFVTKEQIKEYLPGPSSDMKLLMCGPPPMMTAMKKHLAELNYEAPRTVSKLADQVFVF